MLVHRAAGSVVVVACFEVLYKHFVHISQLLTAVKRQTEFMNSSSCVENIS